MRQFIFHRFFVDFKHNFVGVSGNLKKYIIHWGPKLIPFDSPGSPISKMPSFVKFEALFTKLQVYQDKTSNILDQDHS